MKTFFLAKLLKKLRLSSFRACEIDCSARIDSQCELTRVKIGRFSYICSSSHITDAVIGSFCSCGGGVCIGGGLHPLEMVSTSPVFLKGKNIFHQNLATFDFEGSKTVHIGNDVWIGNAAYIKSGVTIGDGAVIGTHAVVTHDVPPYAIVAGVPAALLRYRFPTEVIVGLLALKWWDWPVEKLKRYANLFQNPVELLAAASQEGLSE